MVLVVRIICLLQTTLPASHWARLGEKNHHQLIPVPPRQIASQPGVPSSVPRLPRVGESFMWAPRHHTTCHPMTCHSVRNRHPDLGLLARLSCEVRSRLSCRVTRVTLLPRAALRAVPAVRSGKVPSYADSSNRRSGGRGEAVGPAGSGGRSGLEHTIRLERCNRSGGLSDSSVHVREVPASSCHHHALY